MAKAATPAVDGSGHVLIGGEWSDDFAVIKYSNSGTLLWTNRYHRPGTNADEARAIAVDDSGNVFVTGQSSNINDLYPYNCDYATIKIWGVQPIALNVRPVIRAQVPDWSNPTFICNPRLRSAVRSPTFPARRVLTPTPLPLLNYTSG